MNEFKTYHPIVNFTYFIMVIASAMFMTNPVCLATGFVCAFTYSIILKNKGTLKFIIPLMLFVAILNPLFNHAGQTVLEYFPNGNPLTLESVIFGIFSALMLVTVVCWFSCYNEVMTSDKFIYLFGRVIPSLSLILSMALRFVPRFKEQFSETAQAQKGMGRSIYDGNVFMRAKNGVAVMSAMVTRSLENAVETADSMKSRGYGLSGRTAFSIFRFDKRDTFMMLFIMLTAIYFLLGNKAIYFRYFPSIKYAEISMYAISVYISYFMLCIIPVGIELWEAKKWKSLK